MALNDEQLVELRAELDADPLARGYSSLDDESAAGDLNTDYRPYSFDLPVDEFEQVMRLSGKWNQYLDDANARDQEGALTSPGMSELMSVFQTRIPALDLKGDANRVAKEGSFYAYWSDLLDACVMEGSLGTFARDEAKKLSETTVTRSWELFDQAVGGLDVEKARAL